MGSGFRRLMPVWSHVFFPKPQTESEFRSAGETDGSLFFPESDGMTWDATGRIVELLRSM